MDETNKKKRVGSFQATMNYRLLFILLLVLFFFSPFYIFFLVFFFISICK